LEEADTKRKGEQRFPIILWIEEYPLGGMLFFYGHPSPWVLCNICLQHPLFSPHKSIFVSISTRWSGLFF